MCCFAQPVVSVADTNIFARLAENGSQFLVYQMRFNTETINAMILPLPVALGPAGPGLKFISLKTYDAFFSDLSKGFPRVAPPSNSGRFLSAPAPEQAAPLPVHDVGDFVASFVPTIADFSRLDPQFVIPRETWSKIPEYGDYGFAVFQLKSLQGRAHPMAFEFDSRWKDRIFFPTVHIHDGEVHRREEFDHTLYLQHASFDAATGKYQNASVKDRTTGYVRSKWPAWKFCDIDAAENIVEPNLLVHRLRMQGEFDNGDIIVDTARGFGSRAWKLPGWQSLWSVVPAVLGICGLGWFFARRNRIAAGKKASSSTMKSADPNSTAD